MILDLILLALLTFGALAAVMRGNLLRAAIALAVTSIILTVLMFRLQSPLAAVFELSVCAGLITVVFISTVSLTKPLSPQEAVSASRDRIKRFWYLPVILVIAGFALAFFSFPIILNPSLPMVPSNVGVREMLWNFRQLDLLGQVVILMVGVFGIVVLFKDAPKDGKDL